MKTVVKKLYEGMFLVDSAVAVSDWDGVIAAIETVLKRSDADVVSINKWDERKLAYPIQKKTKGTYFLVYFRAEGEKITHIERDVQLSEKIMRALILNAEHLTEEDLQKETPSMASERRQKEMAESHQAAQDAQAAAAVVEVETVPSIDELAELEDVVDDLTDEDEQK